MLPFTYLIGWSKLDKFYYGVRYSKTCHPNSLWKTYFTSSKIVKEFREKYGEPDIIQIRKTFNDPKSARLWEEKFLLKVDAKNNDKFLNNHNGGKNFCLDKHTDETKQKFKNRRPWNENKLWSIEHREFLCKVHWSKKPGAIGPNKGKPMPAHVKEILLNIRTGSTQSEDTKIKRGIYNSRSKESNIKRKLTMNKLKWCNNGNKNKRLPLPLPEGWYLGKINVKRR
jgi:ribosomal protein S24E